MNLLDAVLVTATVSCALVAGFLFAFAAVVMPGIKSLDDGGFIRAFQVIDRVIQNGQPLFLIVWVGSALAVVAAAVLGLWTLSGADRVLVVCSALVYVLCVQLPTAVVNIPLNNRLQKLAAGAMSEAERAGERNAFEPRWNRWNVFRTIAASIASVLLAVLLLRV